MIRRRDTKSLKGRAIARQITGSLITCWTGPENRKDAARRIGGLHLPMGTHHKMLFTSRTVERNSLRPPAAAVQEEGEVITDRPKEFHFTLPHSPGSIKNHGDFGDSDLQQNHLDEHLDHAFESSAFNDARAIAGLKPTQGAAAVQAEERTHRQQAMKANAFFQESIGDMAQKYS